jgi:tetratricopeptide (TPR) repeat protein
MREELALVANQQQQCAYDVTAQQQQPIILTEPPAWEGYLTKAIALLESTLMIGCITLGKEQSIKNQRASFLKINALLANALEHSPMPWRVLEVLALTTYYLGDLTKAKEWAFNSLNQYEQAIKQPHRTENATSALQGYAVLTLGLCLQKQGAVPLAMHWYEKVPNWRCFPVLLRLDALDKLYTCSMAMKQYTQQQQRANNAASFLEGLGLVPQLFRHFSVADQFNILGYIIQSFSLGFTLVQASSQQKKLPTIFAADTTGQFTVAQACLNEAKVCFAKAEAERSIVWQLGVRTLKRSLRKTPNDAAAWCELGLFYVKANHKTRAIEAFQHSLQLQPTNSQARLELGHLYVDLAQYIAGAEAYIWAFSTAHCASQKRQAAYALSVILERFATHPSIQHITPSLSIVLALLLKQEQEKVFFSSGTASHLAKICQQLGWEELAYWYCLQSLASTPVTTCQCRVNLAYMAEETGRLQEAVYYYRQSIAFDGTDATLYQSLGQLYFEGLLMVDAAHHAFERAIELDPTSALGHYHLGQVYGFQHQWTSAAQAFARARELNVVSNELDETDLDNRLHQLYENL